MTSKSLALVRQVPDSLPSALRSQPPLTPVDAGRAQEQHRAYVAALEALGLGVHALPADEDHPDCCFVEDTAVVVAGRALVTRPGAPSRRGEIEPVAEALASLLPEVRRMHAPATLDGGDVLRVGRVLFVGRSRRTNDHGIRALTEAFAVDGGRVLPLPVPEALHLKSVCSSPVPGLILLAEGSLPPSAFAEVDAEVLVLPRAEAHAANAVGWGGRVLLQAGAPWTARRLRERGHEVLEVDTSELAKVDGALTCLSILLGEDPAR